MPKHECETFDYPLDAGTKTIKVKGVGVAGLYALAYKKVKEEAEKAGRASMANHICKSPCKREIYVSVDVHSPLVRKPAPGGGWEVAATASWKAGILCYTLPAKAAGKKR